MIIGLTGGIGSGKTAASDAFKSLGVDIIEMPKPFLTNGIPLTDE